MMCSQEPVAGTKPAWQCRLKAGPKLAHTIALTLFVGFSAVIRQVNYLAAHIEASPS